MDHSEKLKTDAVVPAEEDRESRRACAADQAHSGIVPLGIGHMTCRHLKLRYFAGGKNGEHASTIKPGHGFAKCFAVGLDRAIGLERVDEDAGALQLWDVAQEEIGEDFNIGANAGQEHREKGAIEDTIRVVGDNNNWAGAWDSGLIRGVGLQLDSHLSEETLEMKALRRTLNSPIEISDFANRRQLSGYAGKVRDAGQCFAVRLTRLQMV
jgi:hypothetical protein